MGYLIDAGVLDASGNLKEEVWKGYVYDVVNALKTGKGILPPGVSCGPPMKPVSGANELNLGNKDLFPEFHKTWRPRYEAMVKSMDVNGDFQLAKSGILPAIDPTAVATLIGATPPDMGDFPACIVAMMASPPMGTQPFIVKNFPDLAANLPAVAELLSPDSAFIKAVIPSPPDLPKVTLPDPRLLEFGYTEEFNFSKDLALAPFKTQIKMMVPAIIVGELPGLLMDIASGNPLALISFICEQIRGDQPRPMSTSYTEIAAQQVLIEHQVKYQTGGFIAQNIGSGQILKAMCNAPLELGGLNMIPDEEKVFEEIKLQIKINSPIRKTCRKLIEGVLPPRPLPDGRIVGQTFFPEPGFHSIAPMYGLPKIDGEVWDWDQAWDYIDALTNIAYPEQAAERGKAKSVSQDQQTEAAKANLNNIKDQLGKATKAEDKHKLEIAARYAENSYKGHLAKSEASSKAMAGLAGKSQNWAITRLNNLKTACTIFNTMRGYTTCGEFPRYVYQALIHQNGGFPKQYYESNEIIKGSRRPKLSKNRMTVAGGGLISLMHVGRGLEEKFGVPRSSIFVIADPNNGASHFQYMDHDFHPLPGDAILFGPWSGGKGFYPDQKNTLGPSEIKVTDIPGEGKCPAWMSLPVKDIVHVALMYDRIYVRGEEVWITADAGQGSRMKQGAKYSNRFIQRVAGYGIQSQDDVLTKHEVQRASRCVIGWLNIDLVPELLPKDMRQTQFDTLDSMNFLKKLHQEEKYKELIKTIKDKSRVDGAAEKFYEEVRVNMTDRPTWDTWG